MLAIDLYKLYTHYKDYIYICMLIYRPYRFVVGLFFWWLAKNLDKLHYTNTLPFKTMGYQPVFQQTRQDLDAAELGGLLSWTLPTEVTYVTEYRRPPVGGLMKG